MPNVQYGPPSWLPTNWDKIKKAKAIQDAIDRASFFNAIKDWGSAKFGGKSTTHEAAKAAGFTGDTAGAADLFLHYQSGPLGRWLNRFVDRGVQKNKYDNIRDSQIDAWNEQMGPNASYKNLFRDVVNNPGNWELRNDPVGKKLKSRKFRIGSEPPKSKKPKRESAYQREQRKRKEEEEKKRREGIMGLNRMRIGAISRPSIVPKPVWDSYVGPDGGNFGRYDDIGRFIGLDTDALYESLGIKALMEAKIDPRYSEFIGLDTIDLGPITEG